MSISTPPNDPYQYLEELNSAQSLAWVNEQNARTTAQIDADPRFATIAAEVLANMQDARQIPLFSVHADQLYNFYQSAEQPRGVYRTTTLAQYLQPNAQWQVLLDIDALALAEQVDWYLAGVEHCTLAPTRCLVSLSIGGGDACAIREYDLAVQAFVVNGFQFPYSKSQVSWRDPDSVFVCPAWDDDQISQAGYSREVVLLGRGQAWEDAASMLVLPETALKAAAWRFLDGDGTALDVFEASHDFYRKSYFYLDAAAGGEAEPVHLPLPLRCAIDAYSHGDLIVRLDVAWQYDDQQFAAGSLIAIACDAATGELGRVQLLFAPAERQSVQMLEASLDGLFVVILDNVTSRVISLTVSHGVWHAVDNPLPLGGVIEVVAQPWRSNVLYFSYSDFLTPASLYCYDLLDHQPPQLLRQQPAAFDSAAFCYEQYHATSDDGTQVPYFVVHARDWLLDGDNPVLLYAYGGFALPLLPYYLDNLGSQWLAQGGVHVLANVRGGGEFGVAWHNAARREKRVNSFADLAAVAQDLIARNITRPARLAIEGGSNGGLLVAATMLRSPKLFGAVVCEVPLLDMLRFDQLHAGASWIAEYGDPAKEEDAAFLGVYSPYSNLKAITEQYYPPVLLTTHSRDDRVHPAHARKMAAKMQALGHVAWFYESVGGGHAGQNEQAAVADELARVLVFLRQQLHC